MSHFNFFQEMPSSCRAHFFYGQIIVKWMSFLWPFHAKSRFRLLKKKPPTSLTMPSSEPESEVSGLFGSQSPQAHIPNKFHESTDQHGFCLSVISQYSQQQIQVPYLRSQMSLSRFCSQSEQATGIPEFLSFC